MFAILVMTAYLSVVFALLVFVPRYVRRSMDDISDLFDKMDGL